MSGYAHTRDKKSLIELFNQLAGRRFLGAVDGGNAVELVFNAPKGSVSNLVTIYTSGEKRGWVELGHVMAPEAYTSDDPRDWPPEEWK